MSCKTCKSQVPCGCNDPALTTPVPCETGTNACPNPDECPETFSASCTVWTAQDLVCNSTVVATTGDRMDIVIERMIALFCGPLGSNPPQESINLLQPLPNAFLDGGDDLVICVDRVNCFSDLTLSFGAGAPAGLLFVESGANTLVMDADFSCINFSLDATGVVPGGTFNYVINITGCGQTVSVPATITI